MGVDVLQAAQDVVAQAAGVGEGVEGEAVLRRPRDAEELGRRPAGHDERVEGERAVVGQEHLPAVPVDTCHRRHPEAHVVSLPEDHPDRIGHVARLQAGGRHLVEEGLERVEVALVDDGDLDVLADQGPGRRQAAESGSHHHYPVHPPMVAQA